MKKFDVYKIDNFMVKAGYIFLFVFGILAYPEFSELVNEGTFNREKAAMLLFFGAGAAAMLAIGYRYRIIENRVNAVLKIVTIASEVSITDVMQSTGFTREQIQEAIIIINNRLPFYYVIDGRSDLISDGRLRTKTARVETCSGCGVPIKEDFPISRENPPACPSCGTPLAPDRWNALKREAIKEIRDTGASIVSGNPLPDFSWPVFVLLMIFFWPAGMIYFIAKYYRGKR
jgi:hypothetical protein